jgi:hypothetical protein
MTFFRKGTFLFLIIIVFSNGACGSVQSFKDQGKPCRLSEHQFLDKYGKGDSSRALIRYFFQRRRDFRKTTSVSSYITGSSGILFGLSVANARQSSGWRGFALGLLLFLLTSAFVLTTMFFAAKWLLVMTRRRLFKLTEKYNAGKGIPKRFAGKPLFKKFLEDEQHRL